MPTIEQRLAKIEASRQRKMPPPFFTKIDLNTVWEFFEAAGKDIFIKHPEHFTDVQCQILNTLIEFEKFY